VHVIEAGDRVGGRIRTDRQDGYRLDRGFQVLQTAYPEARRMLDYKGLDLRTFAYGAKIRIRGRFYTVADPLRHPGGLKETLTAPIGGIRDRLRLARLARRVTRTPLHKLFTEPESTAMDFLKREGFSQAMITRFFVPFFGGVCLDPNIQASSRVLQYVLRMFAAGEAALPAKGMEEIPRQLTAGLPNDCLRTGVRVRRVNSEGVLLEDGTPVDGCAVVVAAEGPETARLFGAPSVRASVAETCLYFSCDREQWHSAFLMLNGEGGGLINNIAFPSQVSPAYAPKDKSLVSVVVLGNPVPDEAELITQVRAQLTDWFGPEIEGWVHLRTYRILHALSDQMPPTQNPFRPDPRIRPGVFVCGEYGSLPGIQWALLSGGLAADAVTAYLGISSASMTDSAPDV